MKKKIFLTILGLLLLVGAIIGVKVLQIVDLIQMGETFEMPPETVVIEESAIKSLSSSFQSIGSVEAARGVMGPARSRAKSSAFFSNPVRR
ncbi:MAG: hypothetical protein ACKOHM_11085 [Spartobacteria bacterium]